MYKRNNIFDTSQQRLWEKFLYFILIPVILIICLELFLRFKNIPSYIIPLPSGIIKSFFHSADILLSHAIATLTEAVLGFLAGGIIAVVLAIVFFYYTPIRKLVMPFVIFSQVFPKVSLAPIFLIWFGLGLMPKVVISALMCFFPILTGSIAGFNSVLFIRVDLFRSLSATRTQTFFKLRVPSALPFFFPALKTAVVFSVIGAIVGEFVSANKGLGYLIQTFSYQMEMEKCFAAVIMLAIGVAILFSVIVFLENTLLKWKEISG